MKIFITGGTGFVGRQLVRRLKQTGHKLFCLARRTSDARELKDLGANIITGDINDWEPVRHGMRGCDWVIHLAGVNAYWQADRDMYRRVNVKGTRNVMQAALETGISKVVHVSSIGIFGKPDERTIREESPVGAARFSDYAQSKYEADLLAWQLYREEGLPLVVVYPCAMLGGGDTSYIGEFLQRIMEGVQMFTFFHDSRFSFVHVKDVAEIILRAAEHEDNTGQSYIAANATVTLKQWYDLIAEVSGISPPRLRLPDALVMPLARACTRLADIINRPPPMGLSIDALRTLREGVIADGSKAQRDLGISYHPLRKALVDDCGWHQLYSAQRLRAQQVNISSMDHDRLWEIDERRNQDRRTVDLICELDGFVQGDFVHEQGQAINISRGGMYVLTGSPLDEGSYTRIRVIHSGDTVWFKGKVLRSAGNGMAIGFERSVSPEIERMFESWSK